MENYLVKNFKVYLRALDEKVLKRNKNKEISDRRIELVPYNRDDFDFISFIDFANAIHFDYYSMEMVKKSDKNSYLELYKRILKNPKSLPIKYSFYIEFGQNFSFIRVFIRHYMDEFEYKIKDQYFCIELTNTNQSDQFQYQIFQSYIQENTPIYETAKYFTNKKHNVPYCIEFYFSQIIQRKSVDYKTLYKINTIEDLLKYCPGHIKIEYSDDDRKKFNKISIIFPWAFELIDHFHYLELDGSFRAMKPYAFCIAQGIFFNESIPFGISITPTESELLYQQIFEHLNSITSTPIQFCGKIILSDMGLSIKSICNKFNMTQYFCHRHIIEHFGASCVLGILCKRILKTYSIEEYDQICIEIQDIINEYKEERRKQKTYTTEFASKVKDLETMISGDNGDMQSNYFYIRWALWIRSDHHAGTCSNHNESLHAFINKDLHKCLTMEKKLSNLIKKTIKHCTNLKNRKGTSIKRKLKNIITFLIQKIKNPTFDILNFCDENCKCGEKKFNENVYGVPIPCLNQFLLSAKEIILIVKKDLEKSDQLSINNLLHDILITNSILKEITADKLVNVTDEIFSHRNNLSIPKDHLIILVKMINKCFLFDPPEIPEIKNMWTHHDVVTTFSKPKNNQSTSNNEWSHQYSYDECEDEEVFFSRFKIEDKYFRKKIIIETVKEIVKVYPKINVHEAYEICIDKFDTYFVSSKLDVSKLIARYKINCWKCADKLMEMNSFFK